MPASLSDVIAQTLARSKRFRDEALAEVVSRMPWDQAFDLLSTGHPTPAKIVKISDIFWRADPNPYRDQSNPVYESQEQKDLAEAFDREHGSPRIMFDVEWGTGHIEFTLAVTGAGGMPTQELVLEEAPVG